MIFLRELIICFENMFFAQEYDFPQESLLCVGTDDFSFGNIIFHETIIIYFENMVVSFENMDVS